MCLYDRTIMHQGENDVLTCSESTVEKAPQVSRGVWLVRQYSIIKLT